MQIVPSHVDGYHHKQTRAGFGEKHVEETAEGPERRIMFARVWVD